MAAILSRCAIAFLFLLALAASAAPRLVPPPNGAFAVIAPFGSAALAVAAADGVILRSAAFDFVVIADGDESVRARLQAAGAILLSPIVGAACLIEVPDNARA